MWNLAYFENMLSLSYKAARHSPLTDKAQSKKYQYTDQQLQVWTPTKKKTISNNKNWNGIRRHVIGVKGGRGQLSQQ